MRLTLPISVRRVVTTTLTITSLMLTGVAATTSAAAAPKAPPVGRTAADPIAHDPTMIKMGDHYYVFITGDSGAPNTYLPMKRSTDLVHWEELGPVFTSVPQWIVDAVGGTPRDFWAPDINFFNGKYYLYYAASGFGRNRSVIALATNVTLDPASPDYEWVDEGLVLASVPTDNFNAIDPDVSWDENGVPWLSYGSFWAGLFMRQLDPATGKLSTTNTTVHHLVDRLWAPNAVEGPSIVRHGGYYYLFASFDYCCRPGDNSDYRAVVGRSTSITGPYVDRSGLALLNGGGTELLRGYNEFAGPGHGDIYVDGDTTWFVHHYYDRADGGRPKLSVREVLWIDGWPTLSDPLTGSSQLGHGDAYFQLIERFSGTAIGTLPGGPQAPLCGYEGADIVLQSPTANPCQQWRFERPEDGYFGVLNRHSNKVFDAAFCGYANGTNIGQWGWLDNDCQKFRLVPSTDGWTRLQNRNEFGGPGKFIDAAPPCADGANIQLWTLDDARCQQFRLQPVGAVLLVNADSGRALNVKNCKGAGNSNLFQSAGADACARWTFEHTSDGYYRIVNSVSGKPLALKGCPAAARGATGREPTRGACTEWRIQGMNDGTYQLVNRSTAQVLAVTGCGTRQGPEVQEQPSTGSACQRFRIALP